MAKILRLFIMLAIIVVVVCTIANMFFGVWVFQSNVVSFRGVENNVVYTIIRLLKCYAIYNDPTQAPFAVTQYSPLYYLICTGVSRFSGASPNDVALISSIARGVSIVCSVVLLATLYFFSRLILKCGGTLAVIFSGTAFILCTPWLFLARPDTLYWLFLLLTIALTFVILEKTYSKRVRDSCTVLCGIFTAAAILTKQSGIQLPLIIIPFLMICREWRRLTIFIGSTVLVLTMFVIVFSSTLGQSLWENLVEGIQNGIRGDLAFRQTYHPFFSQLSILLATGVIITLDWWVRRRTPSFLFLLWAMWGLFIFSTVTGLKDGSAWHYYIDYIILWAALMCTYVTQLRDASEGIHLNQNVITVLMLSFLVFFLPFRTADTIKTYTASASWQGGTYGSRIEVGAYLREKMSPHSGAWVFSADQILGLFLPENVLFPQPDVINNCPLREEAFSNFHKLVNAGRLVYAIDTQPQGVPPGFPTDLVALRLETRIGNYRVFKVDSRGRGPLSSDRHGIMRCNSDL